MIHQQLAPLRRHLLRRQLEDLCLDFQRRQAVRDAVVAGGDADDLVDDAQLIDARVVSLVQVGDDALEIAAAGAGRLGDAAVFFLDAGLLGQQCNLAAWLIGDAGKAAVDREQLVAGPYAAAALLGQPAFLGEQLFQRRQWSQRRRV